MLGRGVCPEIGGTGGNDTDESGGQAAEESLEACYLIYIYILPYKGMVRSMARRKQRNKWERWESEGRILQTEVGLRPRMNACLKMRERERGRERGRGREREREKG